MELPPGFRFHPTDEELVDHYLCRKCAGEHISAPVIADIDLYKYDPWQLPDLASYGEKEWYFFSPRDRKYPNGSRPNRVAGRGYWKATGADKPVGNPKPLAIKKALVFYAGKPPKGIKTNWIMHEYRLANVDRSLPNKNNALRLDDWVLCRLYNKKGAIEKCYCPDDVPEKDGDTKTNNDVSCTDVTEHVSSSELTCEMEVQSDLKWRGSEGNALDGSCIYFGGLDCLRDDPFGNNHVGHRTDQFQHFQDVFMDLLKPF